jgi:hypothetical protein
VDRVKGNAIPAKAGIQSLHSQIFSYRSSQDGLVRSISFNFHALPHFFILAFAGTGSVFPFGTRIPKIHGLHTKLGKEHCLSW